jgi:formate dehydrogenase major subunit
MPRPPAAAVADPANRNGISRYPSCQAGTAVSHIQEDKALACDIRPGRRPRGPAVNDLVRSYQQRAGITPQTGTEV